MSRNSKTLGYVALRPNCLPRIFWTSGSRWANEGFTRKKITTLLVSAVVVVFVVFFIMITFRLVSALFDIFRQKEAPNLSIGG